MHLSSFLYATLCVYASQSVYTCHNLCAYISVRLYYSLHAMVIVHVPQSIWTRHNVCVCISVRLHTLLCHYVFLGLALVLSTDPHAMVVVHASHSVGLYNDYTTVCVHESQFVSTRHNRCARNSVCNIVYTPQHVRIYISPNVHAGVYVLITL